MKKAFNVFDHAETLMKGVKNGVLLTTKAGGKVNAMAISWGGLAIEWNKPVFITFVRTGRLTREMLDQNGEFTVNVPMAGSDMSLVGKCGSVSGREVDKIAANGLTLVAGDKVSVPAIKEFPLTLECRVVYRQLQDKDAIGADARARFYPDLPSTNPGGNRDFHVAYYGEILAAYIIE